MNEAFRRIARRVSDWTGNAWTFVGASIVILVWFLSGPLFNYSDTWQLVINTGTTIVTFLMVFLIQNTQNRDSKAVNLKLDELIRAVHGARNTIIHVEDMTDEELEQLHNIYVAISEEKHKRKARREAQKTS